MKLLKALAGIGMVAVALLLQGCATESSSGSVYSRGQAQNEQVIRFGTVESVRQVTIQSTQTGAGTLLGSAIGGIAAGSTIGGGNGAVAAGLIGAILGGMAGSLGESQVGKRAGLEITVRLDNDEMRAITQEADEQFLPGQRVRLLSAGGTTRVTH